jgi:hypothetical protein
MTIAAGTSIQQWLHLPHHQCKQSLAFFTVFKNIDALATFDTVEKMLRMPVYGLVKD